MKICSKILTGTQIYDPFGSVCLCCFADSTIGKLTENTMDEIWNSEKARQIFDKLAKGDYSLCSKNCPYLQKNNVPVVEIDEIPKLPTSLSLSYENNSNYENVTSPHGKVDLSNISGKQIESMHKSIEKNLESILPNIKHIFANNSGELFASKSILKQLANWSPVAPPEEIEVSLETNGSLFDESNWKQIENLGKYKLDVRISILSFNEYAYQTLSGTKLSISKLEENLKFVKSLREKEIINHLEIDTIVQERNFRTLPEFIKKCVEEFNADSVKLIPYIIPSENRRSELAWFTDIKNNDHPYHEEYLQILKDPIFKNPKVEDLGLVSKDYKWELPYKVALENEIMARRVENNIICKFLIDESFLSDLNNYVKTQGKSIIVHGAKAIGLFMAKNFLVSRLNVSYITTNMDIKGAFFGIPVVHPNELPIAALWNTVIVVTDVLPKPDVLSEFVKLGYGGQFITLQNILEKKLIS